MATAQSRVLIAGMAHQQAAPYVDELADLGFECRVVEDASEAARLLARVRVEAVVAAYPLPPGELGSLVTALHQRGSRNSSAALLLISPPESLRAASSMVGRGVHKALSTAEDPRVLRIVVERMVHLEQPMAERMQIQLPVVAEANGGALRWQTENLSGGGMLVCAKESLPLASDFDFEISLPSSKIQGTGRVVRHAHCGRETVDGLGVRFLSFREDGRDQLLEYLRSLRLGDDSEDEPLEA